MSAHVELDYIREEKRYRITLSVADDNLDPHIYKNSWQEAVTIPREASPEQVAKKLHTLALHIEKRFENCPKRERDDQQA